MRYGVVVYRRTWGSMQDVAPALVWALSELGHDAKLLFDSFEPGRKHIVLIPQTIEHGGARPPAGSILYNMEQMTPDSAWGNYGDPQKLRGLFGGHETWDYSETNQGRLAALGLPAKLAPFGWAPLHGAFDECEDNLYDVCFFGSKSPRRVSLLQELRALGLRVADGDAFGERRNEIARRSAVLLNVRYYRPDNALESVRLLPALARGNVIVCEESPDPLAKTLAPAVSFASYGNLAAEVRRLVMNPAERKQRREAAKRILPPLRYDRLLEPVVKSERPRMKFIVSILALPGIPTRCFEEAQDALHEGLLALGHESRKENTVGRTYPQGGTIILLGWNLLPHRNLLPPPPRTIFYQMEQLAVEDRPLDQESLRLLRTYRVWDYTKENVELLRRHGILATYVPLGSSPTWRTFEDKEESIDIVFAGALSPRRRSLLGTLRARGLSILTLENAWGKERDDIYQSAKIILNVGYWEKGVFAKARIFPPLYGGKVVVSEAGRDPEEEKDYAGAVAFARYDDIFPTLQRLLADPGERARRKEEGKRLLRERPMSLYLAPALSTLKTVVLINNRDRLTTTRAMVEDVVRMGGTPIVLDNDSSYPPLLAWYKNAPCEIVRLGRNLGSRAPWLSKAVETYAREGNYVVTDSDLDLSEVPSDALYRLQAALDRAPWATKTALSLRTDDLPPECLTVVWKNEHSYWERLDPQHNAYLADTDTTFALYRSANPFETAGHSVPYPTGSPFYTGMRLAPPYAARHLPWYQYEDSLSEEDRYYRDHASRETYFSTSSPVPGKKGDGELFHWALADRRDNEGRGPLLERITREAMGALRVADLGTGNGATLRALLLAKPSVAYACDMMPLPIVPEIERRFPSSSITVVSADLRTSAPLSSIDVMVIDTRLTCADVYAVLERHAPSARKVLILGTSKYETVGEDGTAGGVWHAVSGFCTAKRWRVLFRETAGIGMAGISR